jgi:hypothetical protein
MRALPGSFNRRFVDAARVARMLGFMPHPAELTRRARSLRRAMTEAERRLWSLLRGRRLGGHKFVRQVPIGGFIADFCCREAGLVIEADGSRHAGTRATRSATASSGGPATAPFGSGTTTSCCGHGS